MTVPRPLPALTADNRPFWTGGERGELLIEQCSACAYYIHPPTGFCPQCESRDTAFVAVSGRGFVESFTINHKIWMPGLPDRYVLALVRIAEQADVRLVTNITGCHPAEVTFDMQVRVIFEQAEDLWIPLFEPDPRHMTAYAEKQTAIVGIGQSKISRGADKSALGLTIDAALQAIDNAGLRRSDIDGMACWPGGSGEANGFAPVSIPVLQDALRLELGWYSNASETSGQYGALFNAIGAISAGLARHVLVFRTMYEATARKSSFANALNRPGERVYGIFNWYAPYHVYAAALQQALFFNRYVYESGIRPEQIAQIAINGRRNAALNPAAIYRTPITLDDYMAAPIIATPLRLLDCDVPIDGSTAIILSHRDAAKDGPNPLTWIEAVGSSMRYRNNWVQLDALATQAQPEVAKMLWNRTDLTITDVDVAELYDGFSFHTINWLENLGVCGRYEAKDFIADGKAIALDGAFPINTNGGALSAGRMHAYGQVHEACTQLWGLGGARQVQGREGREGPKVAVMTTAGGPLAGAFLLARD